MSVVDAPPGLAYAGRAAGELGARPASIALARRALTIVVICGVVAMTILIRRRRMASSGLLASAPLVAVALGMVGYAVRRARLRIDRAGARWGWDALGFRMGKGRLDHAILYRDAVAFRRASGSPWYLARYDFAEFDRIPAYLRSAGIGFEVVDRKAPWRARLQTYGVALDLLLIVDVLFALGTLFLAAGA